MPVNPQVQTVLDAFDSTGIGQLSALSVDELRAFTSQLAAARSADAPVLAQTREVVIPGPSGDIPARLYRPVDAATGLLVYFHGGGWTIGSVAGSDATCRWFADAAGVAILSIDYRLAPEHQFPAAVDDCWTATEWAAGHSGELEVDALRLAVVGDSAGGNLAAVVALMARDAGWPDIRMQALVYPAVDARCFFPSYQENACGYFLTKDDMHWFYDHYGVGSVVGPDDWRVSPLLASTHVGVAPAAVVTAGLDPLRDEGTAYANLLRDAGVHVTHLRYDDMIHGFFGMRDQIDAAADVQRELGALLREALSA